MSQKKVQLLNPLSGNINVAGVITASSFVGSGEGLTGVASTDNIQTSTPVTVLSDVTITGVTTVGVVTGATSVSAGVFYGDGSALTGIDASTLKSGSDTKAQAVSTGVNITGNLVATGNVSLGGTLTYQDVTNMDVLGIGTFQQGIQVLANGLDITGVSTFKSNATFNSTVNFNDSATFADDDVLNFGASSDGRIFFENSANEFHVRVPGGSGKLTLGAGAPVQITNEDGNTNRAVFTGNGVAITGVCTATSFSGDGSALTGLSVGISTAERSGLGNTTIFLDLSNAQHHTITLAAGISTIDCTGGSVGDSHSVVLINPSSVGTGVTVGFATDFLFPSGSTPSLPTGASDISMLSFVVKQTGAGGTEVLASAGLNYSN